MNGTKPTKTGLTCTRSWRRAIGYLILPWLLLPAPPARSFHDTPSCGFCETFAETDLWLLYPKDFAGTYFEQRVGPQSQIDSDAAIRKSAIEASFFGDDLLEFRLAPALPPRLDLRLVATVDLSPAEPGGPTTTRLRYEYEGEYREASTTYTVVTGDPKLTRCPDNPVTCRVDPTTSYLRYSVTGFFEWEFEDSAGLLHPAWHLTNWQLVGTINEQTLPCGGLYRSSMVAGIEVFDAEHRLMEPIPVTIEGTVFFNAFSADDSFGWGLNFTGQGVGLEDRACLEARYSFPPGQPNAYSVQRFVSWPNDFDTVSDLNDPRFTGALPNGILEGLLVAATTIDTADGVDVQQATLNLIQQSAYIRTEKKAGESDEEFSAFLAEQDEMPPVRSIKLTPDLRGRFTFDDLFLEEAATTEGTSSKPIYYSVSVTNAESDEVVVITDPEAPMGTTTLETITFHNATTRNLRARPSNFSVVEELSLSRGASTDVKMFLANFLRGPATENNYKAPEDQVIAYLETIIANPALQTDEVMEGLQRAIWAERVVRDSSLFANQLLALSLTGLGAFMADVYDEVISHIYKGKSTVEKDIKAIESQSDLLNKSVWKLDPDFDEVRRKVQIHLNGLKTREADAGFVDDVIINGIKTLLVEVETVLVATEALEAETAGNIKDVLEKTLVVVFKGVKAATLDGFSVKTAGASATRGGLLKFGKLFIPAAISQAKPVLLDGTSLSSFTKLTAPALQYSADQLTKPWEAFDLEQYTRDRARVVNLMKRQSDQASFVIADAQVALGLASGLGAAEAGAGLISTVPAAKWVKVLEVAFKFAKFGANAQATIKPFQMTFGTLPGLLEEGVYHAYGATPPPPAAAASAATAAAGPVLLTQINVGVSALTSASADAFMAALNDLSGHILLDDIGAALDITGGEGIGSYIATLTDYNQNVSIFMTQVSGAGLNLQSVWDDRLDYRLAEADLADRITQLYLKILTLEFGDPTDTAYLLERDHILSTISRLIAKIEDFNQSMAALSSEIGSATIKPAVVIHRPSLTSNITGEGVIKSTPEAFTLRAHVRNISDVIIDNLSAELTVDSARESIATVPLVELPIDLGSLAANDGVDGTGPDEADIEWQIDYQGDLVSEVILFSINLLEAGEAVSSIVTNGTLNTLTIDPSVDDKDFDQIPDSLELTSGLDPTVDDALDDDDMDGLSNYRELMELGTDPQNPDSDGDGLSDGEELIAGVDGYITDPLNPDTDDDGVPDGADGQPLDGATSDPGEQPDEPVVAVAKSRVFLNQAEPIATVAVTNIGSGILTWAAVSSNEAIAIASPGSSERRVGDGLLFIRVPPGIDFDLQDGQETTITVVDVTGGTPDSQTVTVVFAVPEPASRLLMAAALLTLAALRSRKGRSAQTR